MLYDFMSMVFRLLYSYFNSFITLAPHPFPLESQCIHYSAISHFKKCCPKGCTLEYRLDSIIYDVTKFRLLNQFLLNCYHKITNLSFILFFLVVVNLTWRETGWEWGCGVSLKLVFLTVSLPRQLKSMFPINRPILYIYCFSKAFITNDMLKYVRVNSWEQTVGIFRWKNSSRLWTTLKIQMKMISVLVRLIIWTYMNRVLVQKSTMKR
jgi:hypothetical protein